MAFSKKKPGSKLGVQPEWNGSVQPPNTRFPDRAQMRTISEHQSIKPEYNFRAEVLPTTYKDTIFVPKASKFQFDQSKLLKEDQKDRLEDLFMPSHVLHLPGVMRLSGGLQLAEKVHKNPSMNNRVEFPIHPDLEDSQWNDSTQLNAASKMDYYARNGCHSVRELTKQTNEALVGKTYVGPKQREVIFSDRIRQMKQAKREKEAPVVEAALQVPFTLSNMRQGLLPDLVSQFAVMQKADDESGTS